MKEKIVPKRHRSKFKRRYNPYLAIGGFAMMLAGAMIVLVIFYLEQDVSLYKDRIIGGAAMAFVGWFIQLMFGNRQSSTRR